MCVQERAAVSPRALERGGFLTSNTLKVIAVAAMFFDHFCSVFAEGYPVFLEWLRVPGRLSAPLMCYLIAEGYWHTHDLKKYMGRLFLFAVLSHFPYVLYYHLTWWKATSVIWTLFLGLLALTAARQPHMPFPLKLAAVGGCCLLAYPADWNYVGVLWILYFGLYHRSFGRQMASFALIGLFLHVLPNLFHFGWEHLYQCGIFLAIPLLACYNGRRGRRSRVIKWGFYLFYPLHLLLLLGLRVITGV